VAVPTCPSRNQGEIVLKQIRRHLTYANVMSSIAVFLMLGGATAFAATKIGANELKANSVKTGKIVKEAVTAGKIKKNAIVESKIADGAVTTNKLADNAVTTSKIASEAVTNAKIANNAVSTAKIGNDAVTGAKVNESTLSGVVQNVTYVGAASPANSEPKFLTADCGPGRKVLGAFYEAFDFGGEVKLSVTLLRRVTIGGEANRGVQAFASEVVADADVWQLTVSATCATL
jgi:hypothetical protein